MTRASQSQLHLVDEKALEEIRAASLARATRPCDEHRADILKRDWSKAMVWADRQRAIFVPDVRRVRRG